MNLSLFFSVFMFCAISCELNAQIFVPDQYFFSPDYAEHQEFGYSVVCTEKYLIAGARFDSNDIFSSGAAYLFNLRHSREPIRLTPPMPGLNQQFGSAVGANETHAFVGSPWYNGTTNNSGGVFVFDINTAQYITTLLPNPTAANGFMGSAIRTHKDKIAVGAFRDPTNATNAGLVYLFDSNSFKPTGTLSPLDAQVERLFGYAIAMNDTHIFVGAPGDDDLQNYNGAVYVFDYEGNQIEKLTPPIQASGSYGVSIDANNQILVVGSPGTTTGNVFIYELQSLNLVATVPSKINATPHDFGSKVLIQGDRILAYGRNSANFWSRLTAFGYEGEYLFSITPNSSGRSALFGTAIDANSKFIFAGDAYESTLAFNSGAIAAIDHFCEADLDGNFILDFSDVSVFLQAFKDHTPAADMNNDGEYNFFDLAAYLVAYKQGCGRS